MMADDNDTNSSTDAAAIDASTAPGPQKQRAPRRPKVATEMMGGMTIAKLPRGRRKRSESGGDLTSASSETPVAGKRGPKGVTKEDGRKKRAKRAEQPIATHVTAIDEMADLIQLEEENKRLRKTLAEKLRAENADLRKRLGLD